MADAVAVVRVHCAECGQPVTLTYRSLEQQIPTLYAWVCPDDACRGTNPNSIVLRGELIDWWKGHGPNPDG